MDNLKIEQFQSYFDEESHEELNLWFGYHKLITEGISVTLKGVPLLKNEKNGKIYLPDKTKYMIKFFVEEANKNQKPGFVLSPKNLEHKRFSFAEKYDFQYSQVDYEYIPGLVRTWDEGFLTPVFFKISVLNKYSQNPVYRLNLFSDTYGTISKGDEWNISFGINKNNKIIMWLGDIDSLPEEEKYYLRSENIPSDHEIHSEFYDAQIEVKFSKLSKQSLMFHLRNELNDYVNKNLSFDFFILGGEVGDIISNLHRPVFWEDKHIGPVIESFNRIFIESINISTLKNDIKSINPDAEVKNKGSLKIFQLWLEQRYSLPNSNEIMCPFYVLYDFRVITSHLQSLETKSEKLSTINSRLGLNESNDNYELIYDTLILRISNSFEEVLGIMKKC